jgi:hypothetical protein
METPVTSKHGLNSGELPAIDPTDSGRTSRRFGDLVDEAMQEVGWSLGSSSPVAARGAGKERFRSNVDREAARIRNSIAVETLHLDRSQDMNGREERRQ